MKKSYVKEWMEHRGLSTYSLAEKARVSISALYRLFEDVDGGRYGTRQGQCSDDSVLCAFLGCTNRCTCQFI